MKPSGTNPAIQHAFERLKRRLEDGEWQSGECLPSIRDLASTIGVSKPSMIRAIARLKKEGLVSGRERQRIRAGAVVEPKLFREKRTPPWRAKRDLVEKDIVSGILGYGGNLPSLKELQARYGFSYRTMKKILQAMAADGAVRFKGRGFALQEIPVKSFQQRIVFVTTLGHFAQRSALNYEHNRMVNLLEQECKRAGLHLDIVEIDFYDTLVNRRVLSKITDYGNVLGFVVDIWSYLKENVQRSHADLLTYLAGFEKPVAMLDELGDFMLPSRFWTNQCFQVFRIQGKGAGERIARRLATLGHTSAVFITYFKEAKWSADRYLGVVEQFSRIGGCVCLVADNYAISLEQILAGSGLTDKEVRTLIAIGRTPSQAKDLELGWQTAKQQGSPRFIAADAELRKNFALLSIIIRRNPGGEIVKKACNAVIEAIGSHVFETGLEHLFKKALACAEATAWICANDATALQALTFLARHGLKVPQDISVAGFDNVPVEALERRLTTTDFNAAGCIHQMLHFIARPPKPGIGYRHSIIEVEGILLERNTTGPAAVGRQNLRSVSSAEMEEM
jgi:DNA-binding LacI/PurR family transcriptional regulator